MDANTSESTNFHFEYITCCKGSNRILDTTDDVGEAYVFLRQILAKYKRYFTFAARLDQRVLANGVAMHVGFKVRMTSAAVQQQLGYFEPNFGHLFGDREFVPQRHPLCALVVCSLLEVLLIDDEVPSVRVAHRALRSPWRCSWTALRCDRLQQTSHQQQVHAFA